MIVIVSLKLLILLCKNEENTAWKDIFFKEVVHTHVQTDALVSISGMLLIIPSAQNLHSCTIC